MALFAASVSGCASLAVKPSDGLLAKTGKVAIRVYTWLYQGGTHVVGVPIGNAVTASSVTFWCKTTFIATSLGVVKWWRYEGNACC
jgi:hypothetical protein